MDLNQLGFGQENRSHSVLSNYEELSFGELEFCITAEKSVGYEGCHY